MNYLKKSIMNSNNDRGLIKILGCDNPSRRGDVVFVHGLAGHPWETWHWQNSKDKNYQPDNFWPVWLGNALDIGIWTFGYSAARFTPNGSAMPLFDQASNLLENLKNYELGEHPIVFVTHSMGGLLVKKMLSTAQNFPANNQDILDSTKGIVFISTPHVGSDVAQWANALAGFLTTVNVEELKPHAPQLRELDEWYRQNVDTLGIKTKVYYETQPTSGVLIVNASSANPGIKDVKPVAVEEANHDSIAKPESDNSMIYLGVKRFIKECVGERKTLPPGNPPIPREIKNPAKLADNIINNSENIYIKQQNIHYGQNQNP
jgi:predicted alpha/beta hydrolase family esterase